MARPGEEGSAGICPLVRAPTVDRGFVTAMLDAGAQGIVFPQITRLEQVREAVHITKYAPLGNRGLHRMRPATGFTPPRDYQSFLRETNERTLTVIQIETSQALALVDQIAATDGVDVLFLGPEDLCISLGCPGRFEDLSVQRAVQSIAESCQQHGKIAGAQMPNAKCHDLFLENGYQLINCASDLSFLADGVSVFVRQMRDQRSVQQS